MSETSWEKIRAKVVLSDLKMKILEAIELFEVKRERSPSHYTMSISLRTGSKKEPKEKSQYRIAEDLGRKYASVVRALKELESYDLIESHSKDRKVTYVWTYKGIVLFPDVASDDAISAFYETVFGDYDDFIEYIHKKVNVSKQEADQLILYLCSLCLEFLEWVRDQVVLPLFREDKKAEERLPELKKNEEYWRELSIVFLLNHLIIFPPSEIAKEISEDEKGSKLLVTGIQKIYRLGSEWFKRVEMDWMKQQKNLQKNN